MNIFNSLGQIISTATNTIVNALSAVDTMVDSAHDVAKMSKATTGQMLAEMEEENAQALASLKANKEEKQ